jgi:large repetitive protein
MKTAYVKHGRGGTGFFKEIMKPLILGVMVLSAGCLEQVEPDACNEPYNKVVAAVEIKNNHQILFAVEDLDFLNNPNIQIDDITLEGDLVQHKTHVSDFSFSLNGIKACRKDGGSNIEVNCGALTCDHTNKDITETRKFSSKVHKFFLNGGMPFASLLFQIKKNQGVLRLGVHGRDSKVVEARLVVSGTTYKTCEEPPPPPPPPPPAVAPDTSIVSVDPDVSPTAVTSKSISFSSDQVGVSFSCSLDGAAVSACSSPVAYSGLASGDHIFKVYSTNAAGLADVSPAEHSWNVDAQAPVVTIDNLADLPALASTGTISIQFSSNEPGTFVCQLDDGAASACSSPKNYSGLTEGAHKIVVSSVDGVGNVSPVPATFQWVIDQTAPVAIIVAVDPGAPINNSSSISIQFAANETATFECSVDNGAFAACGSPLNLASLVEGSHWFEVRATDNAGNQGPLASYNWLTDLTAPVISLGNVIPAQGNSGAHNISVEFSVSEAANVTCSFDGAVAVSCSSPFVAVLDVAGPHSLVIAASDVAGNVGAEQALAWSMDFSAPEINFGAILPSAASNISSLDLSAEVVSSESVQLFASLDGVSLGQVHSPVVLSGLAEGAHVLEVSAVDSVGNPANVITHSFNVDVTPPQLSLSAAITGLTQADSNTLTFSANESALFECNADGSGFGACSSPQNLSGLADGTHVVQVRAVDLAGNVSNVGSVEWIVDTVAPLTNLIASPIGANSYSFALSSSEENSSFVCSFDGAAPAACVSPVVVGPLSPGEHTFSAWATDAAGNADPVGATFSFLTVEPISTTLISAVPAGPFSNQTSATFTFSANQDDATFLCSLDGAVAQSCSSPKTYTGLADGPHTFTVRAVDIFGNVDPAGASHSWTVDTVAALISGTAATMTSTTITVTWTTNEPTTSKLFWGIINPPTTATGAGAETSVYKTTHSVKLTGLAPNTLYNLRPAGTDRAGNVSLGSTITIRTNR